MLKQYYVVSRCIARIDVPHLSQVERIKLEIQLVRLKQLLLMDPVADRIRGMPQSEAEFERLFDQIEKSCSMCGTRDVSSRLLALVEYIKELIDDLKRHADTVEPLAFQPRHDSALAA